MVRKCRLRLELNIFTKKKVSWKYLGNQNYFKKPINFFKWLTNYNSYFFSLNKKIFGSTFTKKMPQIYLYNLQLQLLWICETTKGCVITKRIFFLRTILFHSNVPTNFQSFEKAVKKLLVQKSSHIAENGLKVWNSISIVI